MFFAILLIGPTSLFTNALPADGDNTEPITGEYGVFLNRDCPLENGEIFKSDFIIPDICVSLVRPSDLDNPNDPVISGWKSGLAVQGGKLDTEKYDCRLSYYAVPHCVGLPVGQTDIFGPELGPGPCVNFSPLPHLLPDLQAEANSVKLTCNPVEA